MSLVVTVKTVYGVTGRDSRDGVRLTLYGISGRDSQDGTYVTPVSAVPSWRAAELPGRRQSGGKYRTW